MKHLLAIVALIVAPVPAMACSIVFGPPATEFAESDTVVMAVPVAISFKPEEASDPKFSQKFRQTILWEVLLSWKGPLVSGDKFTTRRNIDLEQCTSYFPVRDTSARLIYARGQQPFADFHHHGVERSEYRFQFLSRQPLQ